MKKVIRVAGCIVQHDDLLLLLERSKTESETALWGIPAGKLEEDENAVAAVLREVYEETQIQLSSDELAYKGRLDIEYDEIVVEFSVFVAYIDEMPNVVLDPSEHADFTWQSASQLLKRSDLMKDLDVIIERFLE